MIAEDEVQSSFTFPAVTVNGSGTINAGLETASVISSPAIVQFSGSGVAFYVDKGLSNDNLRDAIAGAIAGAKPAHDLSPIYSATVMTRTDHADRKWLPWIDGLFDASEVHYNEYGKPLSTAHMLDFSEEPIEQNIETCKHYVERMSRIGMTLEIELGITMENRTASFIATWIVHDYALSQKQSPILMSSLATSTIDLPKRLLLEMYTAFIVLAMLDRLKPL